MAKPDIFEITLDKSSPDDVFHPGQLIQGHVTIECTETVNVRGIYINFEGTAFVHWTRQSRINHVAETKKYFDHRDFLFGILPDQYGEMPDLRPGRHQFPFQFQLPQ